MSRADLDNSRLTTSTISAMRIALLGGMSELRFRSRGGGSKAKTVLVVGMFNRSRIDILAFSSENRKLDDRVIIISKIASKSLSFDRFLC
jgi:hypothetical protein